MENEVYEQDIQIAILRSLDPSETLRVNPIPEESEIIPKISIVEEKAQKQEKARKLREEMELKRMARKFKEYRNERGSHFNIIDKFFAQEMRLNNWKIFNTLDKYEGESLIGHHFSFTDNCDIRTDVIIACIKLYGNPTVEDLTSFRPEMFSHCKQTCREMYFLDGLAKLRRIYDSLYDKGVLCDTDKLTRELVETLNVLEVEDMTLFYRNIK